MRFARFTLLVLLAGCGSQSSKLPPKQSTTEMVPPARKIVLSGLSEARSRFRTELHYRSGRKTAPPKPPPQIFERIKYQSECGELWAYVTPDPHDGKKHPAIVWIGGGDCNSIDDVWSAAPRENDQTAAAYRKAGIVTMFPVLSG
jgi:hypothetical protein